MKPERFWENFLCRMLELNVIKAVAAASFHCLITHLFFPLI